MRFAHMQLAILAALAALVSGLAGAEIYQWTDEGGRVHFAQNLSQVPPRYRAQAEWSAKASSQKSDPVQRISSGSPPASAAAPDPGAAAPTGAREAYRIRVSRAGTGMLVDVRLDNSVTAPFLIDTGASDVLIPKEVADQLGFSVGADTRTKRYATANGVITRPVVMLRTVSLGGAVVENVPASVTPGMHFGLLGLSFFNHFTYNIDTAQGILTLVPNQLAANGEILGGRSSAQWRSEYRNLAQRMLQLEREAEGTPTNHSRELRRLADERQDLQRQLDLLDAEADQARVPMSWRN